MLDKDLGWTPAILLSLVLSAISLAASLKPRIIVLTDISPNNVEPDDMESVIRLLVHADLFEIEGLVTEHITGPVTAGSFLSPLARPR